MLINIWSDFKKSLGQKYTYMYFVGIILLIVIANTAVVAFRLLYGANEGTYAYNLLEYATWCFFIPYYTCIFIADIGLGKDYIVGSKKDGSKGKTSATKEYLSKLFVSFLLGLLFLIVAAVALIIITSIFQAKDGGLKWYSVKDFLNKTLLALPLWYAGVSFGVMFLFICAKKKWAFIGYFIMTILIPRVVMIFAAEPFKVKVLRTIRTYTITQNFSLIPYPADPARNVTLTIVIGLLYGTIATIIGIVYYNRKTTGK